VLFKAERHEVVTGKCLTVVDQAMYRLQMHIVQVIDAVMFSQKLITVQTYRIAIQDCMFLQCVMKNLQCKNITDILVRRRIHVISVRNGF